MIVCLCHGVSDKKLDQIIEDGADSLKAVERACGAGGDCGSCRFQIAKKLVAKTEKAGETLWPLRQTG
jgi:bacterioferritin-associated ferredoxin